MLKHNEIWSAIDMLASINGTTPSGLAKKAGLDPTIFNKSKRISKEGRERWPTTESIALCLKSTGMSMGQFADLMTKSKTKGALNLPKSEISKIQDKKSFVSPTGHIDAKLRNKKTETTEIDGKSFILKIDSKDYAPLYEKGDEIIATITNNFRRGEQVIVATKDGANIIDSFKKQSTHKLILDNNEIESKNINWTARILWKSA